MDCETWASSWQTLSSRKRFRSSSSWPIFAASSRSFSFSSSSLKGKQTQVFKWPKKKIGHSSFKLFRQLMDCRKIIGKTKHSAVSMKNKAKLRYRPILKKRKKYSQNFLMFCHLWMHLKTQPKTKSEKQSACSKKREQREQIPKEHSFLYFSLSCARMEILPLICYSRRPRQS